MIGSMRSPPIWGVDRPLCFPRARCPGSIETVILTDSARFAVDDAEPLVVASFACPYCLDSPSETIFNLEEPSGSAVLCRCHGCHTSWVVAVSTGQALRLAIAPPTELDLQPA
jgi:hypothetical protein